MQKKPTPRATKMGGGRSTPSLPQKGSAGGGYTVAPPTGEKMTRPNSRVNQTRAPAAKSMGGRTSPPRAG